MGFENKPEELTAAQQDHSFLPEKIKQIMSPLFNLGSSESKDF